VRQCPEIYGGQMPLDSEAARRVYDRIGRFQDTQRFYEEPATRLLIERADLDSGHAVFELGCGTARLAVELLTSSLPSDARYLGVDVSPVMVRLASHRLARWAGRATVQLLAPPAVALPGENGSFDRFIASYVFDLLAPAAASALIAEAARLLVPGGQLGLASLTRGPTTASRIVSSAWNAIARRWPSLVGGCRPIELTDLLTGPAWTVRHREVVVRFGVPSEVVVARRVTTRVGSA
jgi:ubiquinone/menaquinone biosynthesis C-methylase UbiE